MGRPLDGPTSARPCVDVAWGFVSRRAATLVVAGLLLTGLVVVAALLPVPYVVFRPGPLTDVLGGSDDEPIITADGADTFDTTGTLDLTTVGVTPAGASIDLLTAMQAWIDPDKAVVPRDVVYPGNPSTEEARERNSAFFTSSQETAIVAALRHLGYDVPAEGDQVVVREVLEGAAAEGTLEPGDQIEVVGDTSVSTPDDVVDAVTAGDPGEPVDMVVVRDEERLTLTVPTAASEVDPEQAAVGVVVGQTWDLPVEVTIDVPGQIGGSSAGLVFAMGVVDTLTPDTLLDGQAVAGTGEINPDGTVGPISGIQQKIAGARDEGVGLFLAPSANCDAAEGADAGDMLVVPVDTLDDAIAAVTDFAAGERDALPSCDLAA